MGRYESVIAVLLIISPATGGSLMKTRLRRGFNRFSLGLSISGALAFLLIISSLPYASAGARMSNTAAPGSTVLPSQENKTAAAEPADAAPHTLAASYYSLRDKLSATLMLNNKSPRPMNAHVTLFSSEGERLQLPPIAVAGVSDRVVDLREYVAPESTFEQGNLQLIYYGKPLQMGAQVRLLNAGQSLMFDEQLTYPATAASLRLENVWWLPSEECEINLVLSNVTDEQISIAVRPDAQQPKDERQITLKPHATTVVDLRDWLGDPKGRMRQTVGGVSVEHSGPKGGLMGRVFIQNAATGFSAASELVDPGKAKSPKLHGAGLRVSDVGGEELTPIVVARNITGAPTVVSGRLPYTKSDGS